jgi:peptidoglycan/LPS O-acetylase OafA/YrhL
MQQIKGLQALRGIAASAVVFSHAYTRANLTWTPQVAHSALRAFHDLVWVGQFGVDLFFALSGFLMMHLHRDQFGCGASAEFLRRRVVRIVPLYWFLSAVGLALLLLEPQLFSFHSSVQWPWALGSFLFVPWPNSYGFSAPILGAGWTLNYEMYFYVLFAIALLLRRGFVLLCGFLTASAIAGIVWHPAHPWAALVTGPLLIEFLMGMVTAALISYRPRTPLIFVIVPALCILATAWHFPGDWRVLALGLPSAILIAGVVWCDWPFTSRAGRFLVLLGNASYSIYLFQVFALPGFARLVAATRLERYINVDALIMLIAVCSCGAGVIVWRYVEQPLTQWAKGTLRLRTLERLGLHGRRKLAEHETN